MKLSTEKIIHNPGSLPAAAYSSSSSSSSSSSILPECDRSRPQMRARSACLSESLTQSAQIQTLPNFLPASVQSKFDLRRAVGCAPYAPRPLGDINVAMRDLDLSDEDILKLVEQRSLIGFNIAVALPGRRGLRILTHSLDHFRENQARTALKLPWPRIFQLIFPPAMPGLAPFSVTGLELKQGLNCSRGHVENLAARHFEVLQPGRAGRGHTPVFKMAGVETWLKSRMY